MTEQRCPHVQSGLWGHARWEDGVLSKSAGSFCSGARRELCASQAFDSRSSCHSLSPSSHALTDVTNTLTQKFVTGAGAIA